MSRRYADYDERDYVRSRYEDAEMDIRESRRPPATVLSDRRTERPARQPDFLREDYGKSQNHLDLTILRIARAVQSVREEVATIHIRRVSDA